MDIINPSLDFGDMNMNNVPAMIITHHLEAEGPTWDIYQIHNMHRYENGWAGIAYHYYIRLDGTIYKGRPDIARGAHCKGWNTNTLGVAFEGNYSVRSEMPEAQFNAWVELKSFLFRTYGDLPIYGHGEKQNYESECPGRYFPLVKVKGAQLKDNTAYVQDTKINNDILNLQKKLNQLRIRDGKGNVIDEDGVIGSRSIEAIKRIQRICGLDVDGVVGNNTWNAIDCIFQKPLLVVGSRGVAVRYLQHSVGSAYDGVFGRNTKQQTIVWQSQNGLDSDGIVGPSTWSKLIG